MTTNCDVCNVFVEEESYHPGTNEKQVTVIVEDEAVMGS